MDGMVVRLGSLMYRSIYSACFYNRQVNFMNLLNSFKTLGSNTKLVNNFSSTSDSTTDNTVQVTFIGKDKKKVIVSGKVGENLLSLARRFGLDLEGACEASCACTTCHVYVDPCFFDKLNPMSEEEEDLLDLVPCLQDNSRLGCQVILSKELDGLIVSIPPISRNFYVDGYNPTMH
ncbi:Adrenodoxin-like protein, mitochondrial [Trichinella pseudospiralis]|uniref:Adrenodoxin-like protein, mitochondrial n=1 Tax=Trichinella pseudospiralis TaxID=6337 RepID=A0A0V1FQ75_TRIPS|nr:Adrenodoxin-like protein, mitochondrial [Trichinella pseudospiralis]